MGVVVGMMVGVEGGRREGGGCGGRAHLAGGAEGAEGAEGRQRVRRV